MAQSRPQWRSCIQAIAFSAQRPSQSSHLKVGGASAPASNAQLPNPKSSVNETGSYDHCTTSTPFLKLTMIMMTQRRTDIGQHASRPNHDIQTGVSTTDFQIFNAKSTYCIQQGGLWRKLSRTSKQLVMLQLILMVKENRKFVTDAFAKLGMDNQPELACVRMITCRWLIHDTTNQAIFPHQGFPRIKFYYSGLADFGPVVLQRDSTARHAPVGAATADKPSPYETGQEFGTLVGPASRRNLIGRESGPTANHDPVLPKCRLRIENASDIPESYNRLRYIYEAL
ncbi:hypothetical protein T265_02230 [Opisthorchis viverrini]|uniref:Uncharacterized protein n=1 Tax=Opisthorchis viverrini TaxID=6198 RepID=A0A074ZVV5_OPIVI|nr:hypothetical protein T265_02230 [Opisthorchis viverrini]KER31593.1 hypothetical protein T265_02230 [Opisthorchis viverrini]